MPSRLSVFLLVIMAGFGASGPAQAPEYTDFASAEPVLAAMRASLPPELKAADPVTAAAWDRWVRSRDREIRGRVDDGEEITLINLLRLGVTYTKEARIDFNDLDLYGRNRPVNTRAINRADDLIRALEAPHPAEGLLEMREFLEQKGFSLKTTDGRARIKAHLLDGLGRLRDSMARERLEVKANKFDAFKERGLSTDSDLFPDFTVELQLRQMAKKGLLKAGSVHRVAIVGPGLDFVNKKDGADFYPPQTTQPFAVIDSLARLGLADPAAVEVDTFDISPRVNRHIARARHNAAEGKPYTIQLLSTRAELSVPGFQNYWFKLGDRIGNTVTPTPVPAAVRSIISSSAVSVRPGVVMRIRPVDLNIVLQTLRLAPGRRYDLVIGTNIFLYYTPFEQSLARANLAEMLRTGGFLISNTALQGTAPLKLADSLQTPIQISPTHRELMFSYVREK